VVAATPTIAVSAGGGVAGSDRITITWAAGSILNEWLEVQVLSNADTAIPDNFGGGIGDVFFWGNNKGNTDADLVTNTGDVGAVFANLGAKPVTEVADVNKSGVVDTGDVGVIFSAGGLGALAPITVGAGGPFDTDEGGGGDGGIASALAAKAGASAGGQALPSAGLLLEADDIDTGDDAGLDDDLLDDLLEGI